MIARSLGSQNFVAERSRKSRSTPDLNPVSFEDSCPVAPVVPANARCQFRPVPRLSPALSLSLAGERFEWAAPIAESGRLTYGPRHIPDGEFEDPPDGSPAQQGGGGAVPRALERPDESTVAKLEDLPAAFSSPALGPMRSSPAASAPVACQPIDRLAEQVKDPRGAAVVVWTHVLVWTPCPSLIRFM
jgi:hypothetical protein